MEHEILAAIKRDMEGVANFHEYFVDICGYRKTDASGGFGKICDLPKTETFVPGDVFGLYFLVPPNLVNEVPKVYLESAKGKIADQTPYLHPAPVGRKRTPKNPPHSRYRYQAVYAEKGRSLFQVASFPDVFKYIRQAADGTSKVSVNLQPHSHRQPSAALLA